MALPAPLLSRDPNQKAIKHTLRRLPATCCEHCSRSPTTHHRNISSHTTLLGANFPENGVHLDGGTDLLVVPGKWTDLNEADYPQWPRLARGLIELKKPSGRFHEREKHQVISELLALDRAASGAVFAVLTDLTNQWHFFWLGENREVLQLKITNFTNGASALRDVLSLSTAAATNAVVVPSAGVMLSFAVTKFISMNWRYVCPRPAFSNQPPASGPATVVHIPPRHDSPPPRRTMHTLFSSVRNAWRTRDQGGGILRTLKSWWAGLR